MNIELKNGSKWPLNTAYNGDCLEFMQNLPDKCIDNVITSPPYNMRLRIMNGKYVKRSLNEDGLTKKYSESCPDNLYIYEYYNFLESVIDELLRISKGDIFFNIQMVTGNKPALFKIIGNYYDKIKDVIIWDKGHGEPSISENVMNSCFEYIIIFNNDSISRQIDYFKHGKGTEDNIFRIKKNKSGIHGACFPVGIPSKICDSFVKPGSIVFDPFLGSFTTAVACHSHGLNWIGCEKDLDYFKAGTERYDTECLQGLLEF